ncbi:glycosyltransferase [Candidatus Enterococcus clewellii]|uniref:Glycosyltransferase 2-like domain-containing protein n=1 Tax=Candidatus Enterococcus clewellii TaxID=1834193 RepID=A0A242K2R4_9ENTE|nr:glycosyltransferase [Enterococcus sp. 9E7_DIV0242]OTP12879.1 hypothetical protein A5888_003460 [Enterococcus sp. 9E7_DIV0242]
MAHTLVVVLVLYKKKIAECPSYNALSQIVAKRKNVYLLIYDNSPKKQADALFDRERVSYLHNSANPGLAQAYNKGLSLFNQVSAQLLLLLDQDTEVDSSYFEQITSLSDVDNVGAFVPIVYSGSRKISPVFSDSYVSGELSFPSVGRTEQRLMAINSGTSLTKAGVTAVGQFNEAFPLDFLDHWIFWKLNQEHQSIEVLDLKLEHDLSVLDYSQISLARYESIISAERLFYQKYDKGKLADHTKHLMKRTVKQFVTVKNRKIWRRTWKEYRLLVREGK